MTILRDEFHQIVDLLPEEEVGPLLAYVRDHASIEVPSAGGQWPLPDFVGMVDIDEPGWAESSEDFLRERLGRGTAEPR